MPLRRSADLYVAQIVWIPSTGCISKPEGRRATDQRRYGYTLITHMKIAYILTCTLPLVVLGCKKETPPAQTQPAPPQQSKTVSDGNVTWRLGAVTMNGTNVPLSNVAIRAVTKGIGKIY